MVNARLAVNPRCNMQVSVSRTVILEALGRGRGLALFSDIKPEGFAELCASANNCLHSAAGALCAPK